MIRKPLESTIINYNIYKISCEKKNLKLDLKFKSFLIPTGWALKNININKPFYKINKIWIVANWINIIK